MRIEPRFFAAFACALYLGQPVQAAAKKHANSDKVNVENSGTQPAPLPSFGNFNDELRQRFAVALQLSIHATPGNEALLRLLALRLVQYEYGLDIGLDRLIQDSASKRDDVRDFFVSRKATGMKAIDPIHAKYAIPLPKINFHGQVLELKKPVLSEVLAMGSHVIVFNRATNSCLPTELEYNLRFLKHVEKEISLVRFPGIALSVASRLWQNGCIPLEEYKKAATRSLPGILDHLKRNGSAAPQAEMLFWLASADMLGSIPSDLLISFIRSQDASGTWRPDAKDPSASAAAGAYVVAKMMLKSGQKIDANIFKVKSQLPPGSTYRGMQ